MIHPQAWRRDVSVSQCSQCHRPFSLITRRHHCRHCGNVFCGACSSERLWLRPRSLDSSLRNDDDFTSLSSTSYTAECEAVQPLLQHQTIGAAVPISLVRANASRANYSPSLGPASEPLIHFPTAVQAVGEFPKHNVDGWSTSSVQPPKLSSPETVTLPDPSTTVWRSGRTCQTPATNPEPPTSENCSLPMSQSLLRSAVLATNDESLSGRPDSALAKVALSQQDAETGLWWYHCRVCLACFHTLTAETTQDELHEPPVPGSMPGDSHQGLSIDELNAKTRSSSAAWFVRRQPPTSSPQSTPHLSLSVSFSNTWQHLWGSISTKPQHNSTPSVPSTAEVPMASPARSMWSIPSALPTPVRLPAAMASYVNNSEPSGYSTPFTPAASEGCEVTPPILADSVNGLRQLCALARREHRVCIIMVDERSGPDTLSASADASVGKSTVKGGHRSNDAWGGALLSPQTYLQTVRGHMVRQREPLLELFDDLDNAVESLTANPSETLSQRGPAATPASPHSSSNISLSSPTTVAATKTGGVARKRIQMLLKVRYEPEGTTPPQLKGSLSGQLHQSSSSRSPSKRRHGSDISMGGTPRGGPAAAPFLTPRMGRSNSATTSPYQRYVDFPRTTPVLGPAARSPLLAPMPNPSRLRADGSATAPYQFDVPTRLELIGLASNIAADHHYYHSSATTLFSAEDATDGGQHLVSRLRHASLGVDGYLIVVLRNPISSTATESKPSLSRATPRISQPSTRGTAPSTDPSTCNVKQPLTHKATQTPPIRFGVPSASADFDNSVFSSLPSTCDMHPALTDPLVATNFGPAQMQSLYQCIQACGGCPPPLCVLDVCPDYLEACAQGPPACTSRRPSGETRSPQGSRPVASSNSPEVRAAPASATAVPPRSMGPMERCREQQAAAAEQLRRCVTRWGSSYVRQTYSSVSKPSLQTATNMPHRTLEVTEDAMLDAPHKPLLTAALQVLCSRILAREQRAMQDEYR